MGLFALQLLEETSSEPTLTLNQHFLWTQIAVLARFIHRLTFHNKIDGDYHDYVPVLVFPRGFVLTKPIVY